MILLDTSGLYAALVQGQSAHGPARTVLEAERGPLVLSPFVLAEVDHFLLCWESVHAETAFLSAVAAGAFELAEFGTADITAAVGVLESYGDLGIGIADSSLVVLAGRYRTNRILTLDERHFRALRTPAGKPFLILPADA